MDVMNVKISFIYISPLLFANLPVKVASSLDRGAHGEFSSPVTKLIIKCGIISQFQYYVYE